MELSPIIRCEAISCQNKEPLEREYSSHIGRNGNLILAETQLKRHQRDIHEPMTCLTCGEVLEGFLNWAWHLREEREMKKKRMRTRKPSVNIIKELSAVLTCKAHHDKKPCKKEFRNMLDKNGDLILAKTQLKKHSYDVHEPKECPS